MKNLSLIASTLLASLPLACLVSGCGGGNDGIIVPTSTPRPTATTTATTAGTVIPTNTPTATSTTRPTSTPTPTGTASTQVTAPFTLSSGQSATLKVSVSGNKISGTLVVPQDPSGTLFKTRQAIIAFPKGTYTISGTFTSPRSYSVTGKTSEGNFTLSGLLPTTTQTGTYSLTYFGRTDSGTIPKLS